MMAVRAVAAPDFLTNMRHHAFLAREAKCRALATENLDIADMHWRSYDEHLAALHVEFEAADDADAFSPIWPGKF